MGVSELGFRLHRRKRCRSEIVGLYPVGGIGQRWTAELWRSAQEWCVAEEQCSAIMLYVGASAAHCQHWCARPQFCSEPIDVANESSVEHHADWNLFALTPDNRTSDQ